MLDKSVEFVDFCMERKPSQLNGDIVLPEGYKFKLFEKGDELQWAKIEASVLEFDSQLEAYVYFQENFLTYIEELKRRCIFIQDDKGKKVATTTAWWNYIGVKRHLWIHWVAVDPIYQGKGLGKAIVQKAIQLHIDIEGENKIGLHTQTWSHKAVNIYKKLGFEITPENNSQEAIEKYKKALKILSQINGGIS